MVQSSALDSALDLARLAIVFDTTSAPGAIAAMQSVTVQSRQVGTAIDATTRSFQAQKQAVIEAARGFNQLNQAHAAAASGYKRGTTDGQAYTRTVMDMKRALDEEAKAAAAVASGHQQRAAAIGRLMAASRTEYQRGAISAQQYSTRLQQLQLEMNKIAGAQSTLSAATKAGAGHIALMSGAVGGLVGILGFQALSAVTQFSTVIAGLPGNFAHAGDELTRFNARITFAFRGSAEAARLARRDIIALARETGTPYSQVSQSYGDLAIAGRGPGLTRAQIGGLTGGFAMLGQMTGADNASTGRALWQFQQALALGRLTSQDYRFMATNMPAIDDALAAGMGVDVNTIPGRISRGEIDANKMVEALIRGVEVLRESAGGLPQTMERARGRIQTEWELLLSNIEGRIKSSEFYQGIMGSFGGWMRRQNDLYYGTPEDQLRIRQEELARTPANMVGRETLTAEVRRLEALVADPARSRAQRLTGLAEGARERAQTRMALIGRARQFGDTISNVELQQFDARNTVRQIEEGLAAAREPMNGSDLSVLLGQNRELANRQESLRARGLERSPDYEATVASRRALQSAITAGTALPPEEIERLTMQLAGARAQLRRLGYAFDRMSAEADEAARDLNTYGPGASFELAQSARGIMATADAQGRPIGIQAAISVLMRQRLTGAESEMGVSSRDLSRRQSVVDAAGGDVAARRQAQLDYDTERYADQFGGRELNLDPDQASRAGALILQFRQNQALRIAQDDVEALRSRERADRERLDAMRGQLALGVQLGVQGRVVLAQAERERELRLQFPNITREILDAERERVAVNIRIGEQLNIQNERMRLLQDTAETVGGMLGDVLGASIAEGIETGRVRGEAALNVLGRSASRIINNIINEFTLPIERQITEFASGWAQRLMGGGGDEELKELREAAAKAGAAIASDMTPAIGEAVSKIALNVTATEAEMAVRGSGTKSMIVLASAAEQAAAALANVAASGEGDSQGNGLLGNIFSSLVSAPRIPGFANGVRNFSGGLAVVGENGWELAQLPPGSNVYSHQQSKAMLGGANVQVQIIDQRSQKGSSGIEVEETQGAGGERVIRAYIQDTVRETISSGGADKEMNATYGATRRIKRA